MALINVSKAVSVSEITERIKQTIEDNAALRYVKVRGEISNLTRRRGRFGSDYLYFTLKDAKTQLSAVMFEGVDSIPFEPKDGEMAICEGMITVYPAYGKYQLKCYSMSEDGEGSAAENLKKLKEKLLKEGLFDQHRPLPRFPKKIAVVTSPTGAALQDIINVISRRYPVCGLCVIPAYVQGENAVPSLIGGIKQAQSVGADVIIFGRGGGSSEDLDAFNSEALAREIFACKIPTISAVGHQIDFTIADLTADLRAPTPSAAAELAVPEISVLLETIERMRGSAAYSIRRAVTDAQKELSLLEKDIKLYSPLGRIASWEREISQNFSKISDNIHRRIEQREQAVSAIMPRLSSEIHRKIEQAENALQKTAQSVSDLNPMGVLARGYSLTEKDGRVISDANELSAGDKVSVKLDKGGFTAQVIDINDQ